MAWAIAAALAAVLMADLPSGWGISGDLDGCTRRGAAYRLSTAEARRANASLQASPSPGRHDFLVAESRGAASMVDASEQLERELRGDGECRDVDTEAGTERRRTAHREEAGEGETEAPCRCRRHCRRQRQQQQH